MILLLPPNHTEDDSSIWRAAIARGMSTMRCQKPGEYLDNLSTVSQRDVFYYGNTLHARRLLDLSVPIRTTMLDPWWIKDIAPEALGRIVVPMTVAHFATYAGETPFFVKCAGEKWFKPQTCTPNTFQRGAAQDDDVLHVQTSVKFVDEVRCWVVDGEILTWSWYRKNGNPWRAGIPRPPPHTWEWRPLIEAVAPSLPRAVVIDLGMMSGGRWHVIEANEPWASGIYDCDPEECLTVILENQKP